jgi:hypothetical protein
MIRPAIIIILTALLFSSKTRAQESKIRKTRFIAGLSGPELLHVGVTHKLAPVSQVGLSVGAGPSMGMLWSSVNLEHRLYFGKKSQETNQKTWFSRQGSTFFPSAKSSQQFTLTLTAGKDFIFKNIKNGITIDAGVFYLPESERSSIILVRSLNLWPALRVEFFFS